MDNKADNDLHTFLNNWLSNLTFDERTILLIGACQMRTRCSGIQNQLSTHTIALDRLIENLGSPSDNQVDIENGKYPTEPIVIVVPTGNPDLSCHEDGYVFSTGGSDADDEMSTDDESLFSSDDDDDLPKRHEDPFEGINNIIPCFIQKDIDDVTTVLDLTTYNSPTKPKESRLRRWRRKAAKNLKKLFTCCVQTDDMCN